MIFEDQIVELYKSGNSAYEILPLTNYKSVHSIYNIIRKHGYTIRSKAGNKNPNLKHNYFNNINSELKAYFLGILYADGTIEIREKSQPQLRIELKRADKYILEKFKVELNSDNKISDTKKNCCRFGVHSAQLIDDLSKFKIVPNKSHISDSLVILEEPYMSHFIRGVFDGDGWVYKREYSLTIGFCGNIIAMENIEEYLRYKLNLPKVKVGCYGDKVPFFTHSSKISAKKIYNYLYNDATIYLKRKKIIFDTVYANTEVTNNK